MKTQGMCCWAAAALWVLPVWAGTGMEDGPAVRPPASVIADTAAPAGTATGAGDAGRLSQLEAELQALRMEADALRYGKSQLALELADVRRKAEQRIRELEAELQQLRNQPAASAIPAAAATSCPVGGWWWVLAAAALAALVGYFIGRSQRSHAGTKKSARN